MGAMCGAYRTGRSRRSTATSYRSAAGLNWNRGWTTALMTRKVWSGKGSRDDLRWYSPKVTTTEDKTLFLTQWPAVTTCRRLTRTPPHFPLPTRIRACQGNDPKPAGSPSSTRLEKNNQVFHYLFLCFLQFCTCWHWEDVRILDHWQQDRNLKDPEKQRKLLAQQILFEATWNIKGEKNHRDLSALFLGVETYWIKDWIFFKSSTDKRRLNATHCKKSTTASITRHVTFV